MRVVAGSGFAAFLDAAPDAMVCVDRDGRIVMVNIQVERLFGYQRDELTGQLVEVLVPEAARAMHGQHRAGYTAGPETRPMGAGMQPSGRRRDGSVFPVDISLAAIDIGEGSLVTAAVRDMTAREQAREELELAYRHLDSFVSSVSHDLRAPLRALTGFSAALLEEYAGALGETGRGYAERIEAAAGQMTKLIDDLLIFARVSQAEVKLQAVDLGAEVADIAGELQRGSLGRRVSFTIQQPVWALADRGLIRTVLQNLLDNAWKFTSGLDDASIEFAAAPDGAADVCCRVRDNGAGFDPAYAGKLFQPFQRLHSSREFSGSGLGLASVRQIVERQGGRTWAEGAVGEGATFYFTLHAEANT
jgi:PAS domain S-box-containing protein